MNLGWKLLSLGISAGSGFVAQKLVEVVWEKGLGKTTPKGDETDADLPGAQIVVFTAVTAGVNAAVTELLRRKAMKAYGKDPAAKK